MSVDVEKIASTEERVEAALGELKKYLDGKNEGSVELVAFIDLVDLYAARDNYRLYFSFFHQGCLPGLLYSVFGRKIMDEHKSDLRIAEQRLALVGERIESRYSLPGYYKAFVDLQDLAAAQLGEVMNYDLYDTYSTLLKLRESLLRPSEEE